MLTPEQRAQIARENGAKSRGPVTAEGKARSSQNALKTGEYAQKLSHPALLCNEDPDLFNELTRELLEIYQPVNQLALSIARQIVASRWQIERLDRILSIHWNLALIDAANAPSAYAEELIEIDSLNRSTQKLFAGEALAHRLNRQIDQLEMRIARLERRLTYVHKHFPAVATEEQPKSEERTQQPIENTDAEPGNEPTVQATENPETAVFPATIEDQIHPIPRKAA